MEEKGMHYVPFDSGIKQNRLTLKWEWKKQRKESYEKDKQGKKDSS